MNWETLQQQWQSEPVPAFDEEKARRWIDQKFRNLDYLEWNGTSSGIGALLWAVLAIACGVSAFFSQNPAKLAVMGVGFALAAGLFGWRWYVLRKLSLRNQPIGSYVRRARKQIRFRRQTRGWMFIPVLPIYVVLFWREFDEPISIGWGTVGLAVLAVAVFGGITWAATAYLRKHTIGSMGQLERELEALEATYKKAAREGRPFESG